MLKSNTKIYLFVLTLPFLSHINKAQPDTVTTDTSYWHFQTTISISFQQVSLSNWAGGGEPSISMGGFFNEQIKFEKDNNLWETRLESAFGLQRIGTAEKRLRKTDDYFTFVSRYGYRLDTQWYATVMVDFRSQYEAGYNIENDTVRTKISEFMAPGYLKVGVGATYKHKINETDNYSVTVSPINLKTIFVLDDELSAQGQYGVEPGEKVHGKIGFDFLATVNKHLTEDLLAQSALSLFTEYSDLQQWDVNWDLLLAYKLGKVLSVNFNSQLIYNEDVIIERDDGTVGPSIQFKEAFGLGLNFKF